MKVSNGRFTERIMKAAPETVDVRVFYLGPTSQRRHMQVTLTLITSEPCPYTLIADAMTVLELATLHLTPGATVTSAALLDGLRKVKVHQENSSKFPLHFFEQIEDSSVFYILGSWASPEAHQEAIAGPENEKLLALLKDHIDFTKLQMYHLALDPTITPLPLDAPLLSVNRHFIKPGRKDEFQAFFNEIKPLLQSYTKPRALVGGWRIEKEEEEKEEFVLFSGFDSVANHHEFAKTADFEKYKGILEFVNGFEIKHGKRLAV